MVVIFIHLSDLRNFNNLAKVDRTAMLEQEPSFLISASCGTYIRRGISVAGFDFPASLIFQGLTVQQIQLVMSWVNLQL